MKIYGAILSPYVRKVLAVAKLKDLSFEHETVMPGTKTPEYLAISPLGKIPALTDGDLGVSDSTVICEYLEDKHPDRPVLPATAAGRARSRWLEEYADSRLAGCTAIFFFERFVKKLMNLGETDETMLASIVENEHPEAFGYLEKQVPDSGFLFGEDLMLADIALFSPFVNARYAGVEVDAGQYPALAGFLDRVGSHPVMAELLTAEADMIEAMGR